MAAAKVKIRILPDRSVLIDGRQVPGGETVTVPAAEAKTLIADGYAEKA